MENAIRNTLLILLIGLAASPGMAQQERGIGGTATGGETEPQKWAIVIGVGDYQDAGISDLPKAVNDARAMSEMLVSMPGGFPKENVILLADTEAGNRTPTRANMMRFLRSRIVLLAKDDTLLVYFAGHGTTGETHVEP